MADSSDRIELTDLDVISRYSLAVRSATAPLDEVVAALRSDLTWLEGLQKRPSRTAAKNGAAPSRRAAAARKTTRAS